MKNSCSFLLLGFAMLFLSHSLISQNAIRDTGILKNAAYEIQIPINWNKKLVMYAHGYEGPSTQRNILRPDDWLTVFLERGFAVARSSYSRVGWALSEGVDDTDTLRAFFIKKYGKPDSVFIAGVSMGGGVTIANIEKHPKHYAGGLALCPLSRRPYEQTKRAFDGFIVFNALFPHNLPRLTDMMTGSAPEFFTGSFDDKLNQANRIVSGIGNKTFLNDYLNHFALKLEDLPFTLVFSDMVLRDIATQSGGNPFDNTNTLYTGYSNDWFLDDKVERVSATVPATRLTTYDRTGVIDKPILMMHTTYDQIISPHLGINNYDALVHQKQKAQNLKVFLTNGQGHCNFTTAQIGTAFDALRSWTTSGVKPPNYEIASAENFRKDTLLYELRIYTAAKGKLNDLLKRFRDHTTHLFEKHGMTNVGYWTPIDNADEKLYYVLSYPNRIKRDSAWYNLKNDTTWHRVVIESEAHGNLVDSVESIFLKTTDFSPNNFTADGEKRVWEFRKYRVTPNNLNNLLDRFRGFTVKKFEELGMTNKIYWTTIDPAPPKEDKLLYYFLTHASPDAAKSAFEKFIKDPDWIKTRAASEVKGGGSLTVKVESIYMYPTDFSKLK